MGFIALAGLLFLAGIISYFELARLNDIIQKIVDVGAKSVVLSNEMLDVISNQDNVVLKYINDSDTAAFVRNSNIYMDNLNNIGKQVEEGFPQNEGLEKLLKEKNDYIDTIRNFENGREQSPVDWYFAAYKESYSAFVVTVKNFMRSTQQNVVEETAKMKNNAYRAIMQGIVALATAIVIIIVFFLLIDMYYIKPVVQITKGLKNYLTMRVPFNVQVAGKDEVFMLKEYIEQLLLRLKVKKNNPDDGKA